MKTNEAQLDLSKGRELLNQFSTQCSNILNAAAFEHQGNGSVACHYEITGSGRRSVFSSSAAEAACKAFVDVATLLATASSGSTWPLPAHSVEPSPNGTPTPEDGERFQAKARNQTIGVTMPSTLKAELVTLANEQEASLSEVLRRLAAFGFDDFVERSLFESTRTVFQTLGIELQQWQGAAAEQVMMRLEPDYVVRLKSAAKEHERSASEMGALCVAHGLAMCEQLKSLESKVKGFKGAAVRQLPAKVGLEPHTTPLLAGVLTGSIRPPRELLRRLASVFSASETLLATYFRRSFDQRLIPSFKAEAGKPTVATSAIRWESAVKKSGFTAEQAKALLQLRG
jgi:hypothetical protein